MRFLALLTLGGCLADVDTTPAITPEGDPAFVELAVQAAAEWTAVGCPIDVADGFEKGLPVVLVNDWTYGNASGLYYPDRILIKPDSPRNTHRALLHELGHMLGFQHRDHGIMAEVIEVDTVTADDCR